MQAIRCATMNGAWYIGMDKEIGSIESGKLADLLILDKNPLDDIHNSQYIHYTMVNGRIYDSETMNEVGNYDNKRAKFWWEANKYSPSFNWHEETNSFMEDACGDDATSREIRASDRGRAQVVPILAADSRRMIERLGSCEEAAISLL